MLVTHRPLLPMACAFMPLSLCLCLFLRNPDVADGIGQALTQAGCWAGLLMHGNNARAFVVTAFVRASQSDDFVTNCRIFCWCGKELPKWVLGDTYCGRKRPGEPRGHKLCITFMQCTECKCKKSVAVDAPTDECWCPKQWQCPRCSKELHGATCSKAGSNIVVVH